MAAPIIHIATALLVRGGRALLVHRHPSRLAYPDSWALPGGHVERGETPSDAVIRECVEELDVQVYQPQPVPMSVTHSGLRMHGFLVTHWTAEPRNAAPHEHDDIRWFWPSELTTVPLAHPEGLPDILNAIQVATEDPWGSL